MSFKPRRFFLGLTLSCLTLSVEAKELKTVDWPMWGGTRERNMVSPITSLPGSWDVDTQDNVKWIAGLGSQTYGNPVVANGKIFVGTNNEALYNEEITGDKGVLMAFDEKNGAFLWQMVSDKHRAGRVNDWPYQGVCSSPYVDDDVLYYVTNRGEVLALDVEGFTDGKNDGYQEEQYQSDLDGDIIWKYDMTEELGSFPHNMANSSPVMHGDLIFVGTSNGHDESHVNLPSPMCPGIIALDKNTGELVWEDNSVEDRVLHGQWSSAAVGELDGITQVVMGQGDGWVRGYVTETGEKLWEFNTNAPETTWPRTRNNVISTPVLYNDRVYIANGQDPEHGEGLGHLYSIDPTKRGDITHSGRVWHYDKIRRSISTATVHEGILYMPDFSGFFHALDLETGEPYWVHDTFAALWSSALVADGKIYLGDEDGDVVVMKPGKEEIVLAEMNMGSSVYSSAVPANGTLYIASRNQLFALQVQ